MTKLFLIPGRHALQGLGSGNDSLCRISAWQNETAVILALSEQDSDTANYIDKLGAYCISCLLSLFLAAIAGV